MDVLSILNTVAEFLLPIVLVSLALSLVNCFVSCFVIMKAYFKCDYVRGEKLQNTLYRNFFVWVYYHTLFPLMYAEIIKSRNTEYCKDQSIE